MRIPRVIIASPWSEAGKTTVAVGLIGAFANRGLRVQPFKVGPDFIDPSYHSAAAKVHSRNLDTWLTSPRAVLEIFLRSGRTCNLAIVEGVMGLFDGVAGSDDSGSTAEIGRILNAPIILVVNVSRMGRSVAALVHGYTTFDHRLKVKGVILNNVGSKRHMDLTRQAVERDAGVPVVGVLPTDTDVSIPARHLGLIPAVEQDDSSDYPAKLAAFVGEHVDLDQILEIAREADQLEEETAPRRSGGDKGIARIGVAQDEAFNFYYQDNIELLEEYGAEVVPFSPIHDSSLPSSLNGMFLGGGFPEIFVNKLEENEDMRRIVKKTIEDGMPVYAECGGLMYLTKSLLDMEGHSHQMVGALDAKTIMGRKLESLKYTLADVIRENILTHVGFTLRGHEFHYSKIEDVPADARFAYDMKMGKGISGRQDGWTQDNVLASYMHIHFAYDPQIAQNFVRACEEYGRK